MNCKNEITHRPVHLQNYPAPGTRGGYILLEALMALALLSVGSYAVHGTIQQAILTRGQAQDYTHARFLLQQVVADAELQQRFLEGGSAGRFSGEYSRFSWEYTIKKVAFTAPPAPPPLPDARPQPDFRPLFPYLAHVEATVTWERGNQEFSETFETLFTTTKFWVPPEN